MRTSYHWNILALGRLEFQYSSALGLLYVLLSIMTHQKKWRQQSLYDFPICHLEKKWGKWSSCPFNYHKVSRGRCELTWNWWTRRNTRTHKRLVWLQTFGSKNSSNSFIYWTHNRKLLIETRIEIWFSLMVGELQLEHRFILSLNVGLLISLSVIILIKQETALEYK